MTAADDTSGANDDPLGIIGTTIAEKYEIERFVAEGGFSVLYKAQHKGWQQPVAVKFLKVLRAAAAKDREVLRKSFVQEGQLLRSLSSRTASILQAHDLGDHVTSEGEWFPYLILEWLEGAPLDGVLEAEKAQGLPPWSLGEIMRLLEPAAKALEVVHRKGIAHRDIKPANIYVMGDPRTEEAFVKVLDFGIAKVISDMAELSAAKAQTGMGISSFTPWYGAPEQFSKRYGATGPWTDVFALGLVIVEMLTQKPPLEGDDLPELAHESTNAERRPTPRTRGVEVSDAVEEVFLKAFAVKTTDRYETAGQFWNALCEAMGQRSHLIELGAPSLVNPSRITGLGGPVTYSPLEAAAVGGAPTMMTNPNLDGDRGTISAVGRTTISSDPSGDGAGGAGSKSRVGLLVGVGGLLGLVGVAAVGAAFLGRTPPPPAPLAASVVAAASAAPSASAAPVPACPQGMVKIPGGQFYMGLDAEEATPGEKPQHQVTLGSYCIDVTEVTVEAYRACSDAGKCPRAAETVTWPSITPREKKIYGPLCNIDDPGRDKHPINCVDWSMADNFCQKQGKRLPTSAEWEYAVRGPDGRVYPWGDEKPDANHLNACGKECLKWGRENGDPQQAMHDEDDGYPTTAPVGSFPKGRSRYGLDDVIGNVMEWVHDWNGEYTKEPKTDPQGPATGTDRVIRGGAWNAGNSVWVRPSFRFQFDPTVRSYGIGFRCARNTPLRLHSRPHSRPARRRSLDDATAWPPRAPRCSSRSPRSATMNLDTLRHATIDAALTTALGLLLFVVVLGGLMRLVPSLKRELGERKNPAVGVLVLSVLIGLGIIVSAAIKPGS
jgi:eukaryotic-like serine/threonine-protein kinase